MIQTHQALDRKLETAARDNAFLYGTYLAQTTFATFAHAVIILESNSLALQISVLVVAFVILGQVLYTDIMGPTQVTELCQSKSAFTRSIKNVAGRFFGTP